MTEPVQHPRILLSEPALKHTMACADRTGRHETGGVLLGFRSGSDVFVTDAVEVPAEIATSVRYVSTEEARNVAIASFLDRVGSDHPVGYVGTWHSHPGNSKASPTDKRTLRAEAADAPDLVVMLVLFLGGERWRLDGFVAHHHKTLEYRRPHRLLRRDPWVTPASVVPIS